jgi:hypothetical protein
VDGGLSDQQIVNLIIHHRNQHREKQRTRLDYFLKTIAKARNRSDAPNNLPAAKLMPDSQSTSNPNGNTGATALKDASVAQKAQLCDRLSQLFAIRILRIIKITGKNPVYRLELEGAKIELSINKLARQDTLRNAIAAAVNKFIPRHKPKAWEGISQLLLDALTEEEGGEEMDLEGSARMYLNQYLLESQFIQSIDGQSQHTSRKPLVEDGSILVSSSDLISFLNRTRSQSLPINEVTAMLSVVGAKHKRVRGKFPEQSRWMLPQKEFAPAQYAKRFIEDLAHATE